MGEERVWATNEERIVYDQSVRGASAQGCLGCCINKTPKLRNNLKN
jgi:hypothetical protein